MVSMLNSTLSLNAVQKHVRKEFELAVIRHIIMTSCLNGGQYQIHLFTDRKYFSLVL